MRMLLPPAETRVLLARDSERVFVFRGVLSLCSLLLSPFQNICLVHKIGFTNSTLFFRKYSNISHELEELIDILNFS